MGNVEGAQILCRTIRQVACGPQSLQALAEKQVGTRAPEPWAQALTCVEVRMGLLGLCTLGSHGPQDLGRRGSCPHASLPAS